ncbi:MAG: thiamine phosphate synthase, partial [Streptosporangiaceae bacterium]
RRPWFAIGGITLGNLDQVLEAGARRVVVVRALTDAPDPAAAASQFAARLPRIP